MALYRTFWLTNYLGQTYSLNSSKAFLYLPSGLGFTTSYEATAMGNAEIVTAEQVNLSDVSGELLFNGRNNVEIYEEYSEFNQFIREKPITLHYFPPNEDNSFSANIVITSLEKTEISSDDDLLHCPITFHMTSHWMSDKITEIVVDARQLSGKDYPTDYPYAYGTVGLNNIALINKGTEDIGLEIEIEGAMENPYYAIYDSNGYMYGVGRWTVTCDYFYINTTFENENVIIKQGDVTLTMPMNYQNMSFNDYIDSRQLERKLNFIDLRCGRSTMVVNFSNEFAGVVKVRFTPRYATV